MGGFEVPMIRWVPVSLAAGIWFGFVLQKGHVFEPTIIQGQFSFIYLLMLKMFLSAAATSALVFGILHSLGGRFRASVEAARSWAPNNGIPAAFLGGSLIGVGMKLGGVCPGSLPIQLSNGFGWSVLLGAFAGSVVFVLIEPYMRKFLRWQRVTPTWDKVLPYSFLTVAGVMAAAFAVIVFALEFVSPYELDLPNLDAGGGGSLLTAYAWPPYFAGMLCGLLQLPFVLLMNESIGATSSVGVLVCDGLALINPRLRARRPFMVGMRDCYWQTLFFVGAVVGGLLASSLSGTLGPKPHPGSLASFAAGMCLFFGARVAGGCTSGHGISGNGLLVTSSMVATCGMFGAAIVATYFFD